MASGVKLSDAVKHAYDDIKKHQKYLYAIFVIKVDCSLKILKAVRNFRFYPKLQFVTFRMVRSLLRKP